MANINAWKEKLVKGDFIDIFDQQSRKWFVAEISNKSRDGKIFWKEVSGHKQGCFMKSQYGYIRQGFTLSADKTQVQKGFEIPSSRTRAGSQQRNATSNDWPTKELGWLAKTKVGDSLDAYHLVKKEWMFAELIKKRPNRAKRIYEYYVNFHPTQQRIWLVANQLAKPMTKSTEASHQDISVSASNSAQLAQSVTHDLKIQPSRSKGGWNVRQLKVDDFLDVQDRERVWLEGMVTQVDDDRDTITIHFLGWDKKWDEVINRFDAHRFAKLYSKGNLIKHRKIPRRPIVRVSDDFKCLSTWNLTQNQIKDLSSLVKECCKIEDQVSSTMLRSPRQASKDRQKLRNEIKNLVSSLQQAQSQGVQNENHKIVLKMCSNVLSSLSETIKQLENQLFSQKIQVEERKLMQALQSKFHIIDIAKDGNCLFSAFGQGYEFSKGLLKNLTGDVNDPERQKVAKMYRTEAVEEMKINKGYHDAMMHEIKNAHNKKNGKSIGEGDTPMHGHIRIFLEKKYSKQDIPFGNQDVLESYCYAMQHEGIYGTDLELKALSNRYQRPIHVYHARGFKGAPHIVGSEYSNNYPVCVVFSIAGKHYNLIVPLDIEAYYKQFKPPGDDMNDEVVGPEEDIRRNSAGNSVSECKIAVEEKKRNDSIPPSYSPPPPYHSPVSGNDAINSSSSKRS